MFTPSYLLPETTVSTDGAGPQFDLGEAAGGFLITLGILAVIEQESLLLSIHGSSDGLEWSADPLVQFPQKFYPGVSAMYLDAVRHGVRYLQPRWKTDRWGRGAKTPMFRLYLLAELISD